jgi:hypothetical protein
MTEHTHTPGAERDEDGQWEVDCEDPTCDALVALREVTARYPTEALAREASAAIITMLDREESP